MNENDLNLLNNMIDEYMQYLYKYNKIYLENSELFEKLSDINLKFEYDENYKFQKMNAIDSFKMVREFYLKYHKEELKKVEYFFNVGVFNVFYSDELIEEEIYAEDLNFKQGVRNNKLFIDLPLWGDTRDIHLIVHEIRHLLNHPINGRKIDNDTLTETISMLDEMLLFDFLKDKLEEIELNNIIKNYFDNFLSLFYVVNYVSKLVTVKKRLGYINLENMNLIYNCNEDEIKELKRFTDYHKDKKISADIQNWYVLGMLLISFMHQEYVEDEKYLEKLKELNQKVRNNTKFEECLKTIGIDIKNPDSIQILKNSLINEVNKINVSKAL